MIQQGRQGRHIPDDADLQLARATSQHLERMADGACLTIALPQNAEGWPGAVRDAQLDYIRSIGDVPAELVAQIGNALQRGSRRDVVFLIVAAVWEAEVRPAIADRKSPAVLARAERAIAVSDVAVAGDAIVDASGAVLDLEPGDILMGRVEGRSTDLALINSAEFELTLWWLRRVGHGRAIDGVRDIGGGWVEVTGGYAAFAASIGATSKQSASLVKPVLDLMFDLSINLDGGRFRFVEAYWHPGMKRDRIKRSTVPGAKLLIKVGDICREGFVNRFGDGDEPIAPALSPVPLDSLPPNLRPRGRLFERVARCDFRDAILAALDPMTTEIVGVPLDWYAIADRCNFPSDRVAALLAEWKRCGRWEEVRPGRWFIGTGEPEGRELSTRSARKALGQSLRGKASVAARRQLAENRLPHNSPRTSPELPPNFPTTTETEPRD